jgi:uncharacterized membrane protein YjjB (DUF3815 family)
MTSWQAIGVRQDMVFIFVFTLALHITFNAGARALARPLTRSVITKALAQHTRNFLRQRFPS